jgi:aspartate carbamoyltransferase catalytic subunit
MNAGDGAGNHPTQTLLDLFTIRHGQGKIDGLNVVLVGDLRYGRTVHSLSHALSRFGASLTLVSPEPLKMPSEIVRDLKSSGCHVEESEDIAPALSSADVVYMTRIQRERFPDEAEYEKVAGIYTLKAGDLRSVQSDMMIMHPLPRVNEIHPSIDSTGHAWYFKQAFNGVPTRMALLCRSLGIQIPEAIV